MKSIDAFTAFDNNRLEYFLESTDYKDDSFAEAYSDVVFIEGK